MVEVVEEEAEHQPKTEPSKAVIILVMEKLIDKATDVQLPGYVMPMESFEQDFWRAQNLETSKSKVGTTSSRERDLNGF